MHRARHDSFSIGGRRFGGNNGEGPKPRPVKTWFQKEVFWLSNRAVS